MFGISRRTFGLIAVAALGCLVTGTLVHGEDAPPAGTGTITGTVTTKSATGDTTPVAGAKVSLLPPKSSDTGAPKADAPAPAPKADAPATGDQKPAHHRPKPIAETTTAADGTYTFTSVAAGTYNVVAMLKGTGVGHGDATVAAGASVKVDITLEQHKKKPAN